MTRAVMCLVCVLAVIGSASLARADFQISYQITTPPGVGPALCATTVSASPTTGALCGFPVTFPLGQGVVVNTLSGSGVQSAANSQQFGSTLTISNTGGTTQDVTIWLADQNFTSPTTPPDITYASSLSITSTTGTGTAALESCVDTSNGLAPPTTAFCGTPAATLTNATLSYLGASSAHNTIAGNITSLTTTPYTLSQMITLVLGAGTNLNIVTSQILTPVPEPASIALFGGAMLFVTLGSRLARRKRNQV